MTLTKTDKAVIRAFTEHYAASSKKLSTDGKRLDGHWMGGNGIAVWRGGKIVMPDLGSKAAQTVQNAVKREAPANWFAGLGNASFTTGASMSLTDAFNKTAAGLQGFGATSANQPGSTLNFGAVLGAARLPVYFTQAEAVAYAASKGVGRGSALQAWQAAEADLGRSITNVGAQWYTELLAPFVTAARKTKTNRGQAERAYMAAHPDDYTVRQIRHYQSEQVRLSAEARSMTAVNASTWRVKSVRTQARNAGKQAAALRARLPITR